MLHSLKALAMRLPAVGSVIRERDELKRTNQKLRTELATWKRGFVPPGHYYSPIIDLEQFKSSDRIDQIDLQSIQGIDLNELTQSSFLDKFISLYPELKFPESKDGIHRYYLDNEFYAYSDGICLYSMLRHAKPRKFIEIGSGFSSAAALDVNDLFLDGSVEFTFVDPYPDRLRRLLTKADLARPNIKILESLVQSVPLELFKSLDADDILLIDSSHVSKSGSDVNHILFNIIPLLKAGVIIHFHDVFFPFEYPEAWVLDGRSWNEAFLLKAFLQFNSEFEIVYFNTFAESRFQDRIRSSMPLCLKRPSCTMTIPGSIWLRRRFAQPSEDQFSPEI